MLGWDQNQMHRYTDIRNSLDSRHATSKSDYKACYEEGNCPRYHDESDSNENFITLGLTEAERYCEWKRRSSTQQAIWWYHLHYDDMPFRSINERKKFSASLQYTNTGRIYPSTPVLASVGSDQLNFVKGLSNSKASTICVKGNPDWELKEHLEQWLAELLTNQNFFF